MFVAFLLETRKNQTSEINCFLATCNLMSTLLTIIDFTYCHLVLYIVTSLTFQY